MVGCDGRFSLLIKEDDEFLGGLELPQGSRDHHPALFAPEAERQRSSWSTGNWVEDTGWRVLPGSSWMSRGTRADKRFLGLYTDTNYRGPGHTHRGMGSAALSDMPLFVVNQGTNPLRAHGPPANSPMARSSKTVNWAGLKTAAPLVFCSEERLRD
ncbi:hypothetical protein LZ30DRAFT_288183 [Colletotrichum cereale]|nr:hypothetical protein LZ30DRAFT_288183 [Colletotrichum cereale]